MIYRSSLATAFILTSLVSLSRLGVAADSLPVYGFAIGEQRVYEMTKEDLLETAEKKAARAGQPQDRYTFTVTAIRKNPDGSSHLLVRTQVKLWGRTATDDAEVRFENDFLTYCDLQPDGSYASNPTLGQIIFFSLVPEWLFPPLPRPGQLPPTGTGGAEYDLAVAAVKPNQVQVAGKVTRGNQDAFGLSETLTLEFTRPSNTMAQLVREVSSTDNRPYRERTLLKLASTAQLSLKEIEALDRSASEYFGVSLPAWQKQSVAKEARTVAECEVLEKDAQALIQARLDTATEPLMRELYLALQATLTREWKYSLSDAKDREELYAQAPVDWATTNINGQPRRRQDYEGRIVVMDFWYRECSWCIKAMPQVKRLYEKYRELPVTVLGVSNDDNVADARFVIDTVGIPYETIRNAPPPATPAAEKISVSYAVHGWPTLVVLDQTGRVAHIHSGEIGLYESVSRAIDKLLAEPSGKTTVDTPAAKN